VTEDDRRALLSRGSTASVPTGLGEVRRHTDGAVLIETELGERDREADFGNRKMNRSRSLYWLGDIGGWR
jgi:hypothetical protein